MQNLQVIGNRFVENTNAQQITKPPRVAYSLDDLQIISELGRGSYGVVFKVKSKLDHQIYVLKQIKISSLQKSQRASALREVQILKNIDSPAVVKHYSSFMDEENLNIVMEYADGGDLQQLIDKQKQKREFLQEYIIWDLAEQIVKGIQHLHTHRIMHRDIKTMNIFLTKYQRIKIGDLGVSKILNEQMLQKTRVGTPLYLAPELVQQQSYDFKVDMWALGCVIYHMAALSPPFSGNNLIQLGIQIVGQPHAKLLKQYSAKLQSMIDSLLEKDPGKRPSADALISQYFTNKQPVFQRAGSNQNFSIQNKCAFSSVNLRMDNCERIQNIMPICQGQLIGKQIKQMNKIYTNHHLVGLLENSNENEDGVKHKNNQELKIIQQKQIDKDLNLNIQGIKMNNFLKIDKQPRNQDKNQEVDISTKEQSQHSKFSKNLHFESPYTKVINQQENKIPTILDFIKKEPNLDKEKEMENKQSNKEFKFAGSMLSESSMKIRPLSAQAKKNKGMPGTINGFKMKPNSKYDINQSNNQNQHNEYPIQQQLEQPIQQQQLQLQQQQQFEQENKIIISQPKEFCQESKQFSIQQTDPMDFIRAGQFLRPSTAVKQTSIPVRPMTGIRQSQSSMNLVSTRKKYTLKDLEENL